MISKVWSGEVAATLVAMTLNVSATEGGHSGHDGGCGGNKWRWWWWWWWNWRMMVHWLW